MVVVQWHATMIWAEKGPTTNNNRDEPILLVANAPRLPMTLCSCKNLQKLSPLTPSGPCRSSKLHSGWRPSTWKETRINRGSSSTLPSIPQPSHAMTTSSWGVPPAKANRDFMHRLYQLQLFTSIGYPRTVGRHFLFWHGKRASVAWPGYG